MHSIISADLDQSSPKKLLESFHYDWFTVTVFCVCLHAKKDESVVIDSMPQMQSIDIRLENNPEYSFKAPFKSVIRLILCPWN